MLGWAAAAPCGRQVEVQREPITAMPVGLPSSHAFQQRSSTGWYRSCSGTSSGVPFLHLELFLLLLWNHVCKGRWMGTDSYELGTGVFTSKPENRVLCCSGRGFALGRCWHHHLQMQ